VPQLKHMVCKLPTLHYRRTRGDMIEAYKIITGKYDNAAAPKLAMVHSSVTRGHDMNGWLVNLIKALPLIYHLRFMI